MTDLDGLLARRVQRAVSEPVDGPTVSTWCEVFGAQWPERTDVVAPTLMFPAIVRSRAPVDDGASASTGVVLHDELKATLGLPIAIASGYELEVQGDLRMGDRLVSTERIASIGEPRATRLGDGRDWVIEVVTTTVDGASVGVERFRMLGYRPGDGARTSDVGAPDVLAPDWTEDLVVDRDAIVRAASANRVWAPAHHRAEAARAAGLPDIILDTSSQVAVLASAAQRRRPTSRIASVDLAMKRPILPGVLVTVGGVERDRRTVVAATVDGREVSRAVVSFAS